MSLLCDAFLKPSQVPQGSMEIKIEVNFYFNTTSWDEREGLKLVFLGDGEQNRICKWSQVQRL